MNPGQHAQDILDRSPQQQDQIKQPKKRTNTDITASTIDQVAVQRKAKETKSIPSISQNTFNPRNKPRIGAAYQAELPPAPSPKAPKDRQ